MSVAVPLYLRSCGTCYSSHLLSPSIGLEILHPSNPGVNTHMTVALWPTLCGRGSGAILCKTLPSQGPFWKAGGDLQANQHKPTIRHKSWQHKLQAVQLAPQSCPTIVADAQQILPEQISQPSSMTGRISRFMFMGKITVLKKNVSIYGTLRHYKPLAAGG